MVEKFAKRASETYRNRVGIVCITLALLIFSLDFVTGEHISFPIAYVLPVGLAAWRNRKILAYSIAVLLPVMRVGFLYPWNEISSLPITLLNLPIFILSLSLYAFLIDRIASQSRSLEKKVKTLEGILPICASCKKIRNEQGKYEQMEKYVTEHSEASFSHGLCPECAKKMYPEYYEKEDLG